MIGRFQIIVGLVCLSSVAYAQTYKCTGSDGTIYYQDSACPSNATTEQLKPETPIKTEPNKESRAITVPTSDECVRQHMNADDQCSRDRSKRLGECIQEHLTPDCIKQQVVKSPPSWAPDISCQQEFEREARRCDVSALIKQCWRERLSPNCMKQVEARPGPPADAACKQELQQAAGPCAQASTTAGRQCLLEHLSSKCREQANAAERGSQEVLRSCQEAQLKVQGLCGTDFKKGLRCYQEHQAELSAACR